MCVAGPVIRSRNIEPCEIRKTEMARERIILVGIRLKDSKTSTWIRQPKMKSMDAMEQISRLKWWKRAFCKTR